MLESPSDSPPSPDTIEISVLGPGYGESIVVHLGDGQWLCVDSSQPSGVSQPLALEYLSQLGVVVSTSVVAVVATHWHDDHVKGLARLFDAAASATFYCSQALNSKEFEGLTTSPYVPSRFSSGVSELQQIAVEVRRRRDGGGPAIEHVGAARRIWYNPAAAVSEIWALSPSSEDIARSLEHLASFLPMTGARRVPVVSPNDASVVLYLETNAGGILLGADLEHQPSERGRGWHAVLDHSARPRATSAIYKVAHHGAVSSYCPEIWEHLLAADAVSIVAPFERGSVVLPTTADIDRIRGHTSRAFVTSVARATKPRFERAVERTIAEATREFRPLTLLPGHLQLRFEQGKVVVRGSASAAKL